MKHLGWHTWLSLFLTIAPLIGEFASLPTSNTPLARDERLVAHEWGTFTSIAGRNGAELDWRPLDGASDLPKFVYDFSNKTEGLRGPFEGGKGYIRAKIRMETPVIYFYTDRETDVSVSVGFPQGRITEWYPQAKELRWQFSQGIDWGRFKVMPGAQVTLPHDGSKSHYYPAREVDAAPVRVCAEGKPAEYEKFLFYRGVGDFALPLKAQLNDGVIELQNTGLPLTGKLFVFAKRGDKVGYLTLNGLLKEATVQRPALNRALEELLPELEQTLMAQGLYEKEARAMLNTWRDSLFEEGLRVLYVLPRPLTNLVLPLRIDPAPRELVRVLVGRTELITPEMEQEMRRLMQLTLSPNAPTQQAARQQITRRGRFAEAILRQMLDTETDERLRTAMFRLLGQDGE